MADFGTTWPVFIGLTLVLFGWASWMTGQAVSATWRPIWHLIPYGVLMAAANRFLDYGLFADDMLSIPGYLLSAAVIIVIAVAAFQATRARKMVLQYPWLYERTGPFSWRERKGVKIAA
jgi:hypothetical protein